jgi:acetylornithine deacetylase
MDQIELERLALRFLEIDSTSGREAAFAECVCEVLQQLGYEVERQQIAPGRFNVAANAHGKSVLFNTHLDTVPPYWAPHFDELALRGRGACDAKGIMASMIAAGERLKRAGVDDFGYLFVVGEEVDGCGARAANEVYRARFVIVGEPTERKLALGHKGVAKFRLELDGIAGHSAYPQTGHSAIHSMLELLHELRATDFGDDELLGSTTLNVGRIEGGHAANVIADHAWAECMLRTVRPAAQVRAQLEMQVGQRARVKWMSLKDPARMRPLADFPTTVVGFASDIPYMGKIGQALLYGPGSILDAHTANEYVLRADLLAASEDYARMVQLLLSEAE